MIPAQGGRCGSTGRLFVSGETNTRTGPRPGKSMDVPGSGRKAAGGHAARLSDWTARPDLPGPDRSAARSGPGRSGPSGVQSGPGPGAARSRNVPTTCAAGQAGPDRGSRQLEGSSGGEDGLLVPGPSFGSFAKVGKLADRRSSRPVRRFRFFAQTPEIGPICAGSGLETASHVELRAVCLVYHPRTQRERRLSPCLQGFCRPAQENIRSESDECLYGPKPT